MKNLAAIRINTEPYSISLYLDGQYSAVDWENSYEQIDGVFAYHYLPDTKNSGSGLAIEKGLDGKDIIRITETRQYRLKVQSDTKSSELPVFPNEGKFLKCSRDNDSMSFQYINYLGRSRMHFVVIDKSIEFEVIPDKMDYETDYVELTEAIAKHCAALLLEHTGSTANLFKQGTSDNKTVLEQFIFLRQFCFSDNLMSLFEAIKRNPDRILEVEEVFKPAGAGIPSKKFYTHPFSYGKEWARHIGPDGKARCFPQKIACARKYDSIDTPANRLIKFAFERFDQICQKLIKTRDEVNASECVKEAEAMHSMFDTILHDSFFGEVGDLDMVPQNNQVLLKREGYSQVFAAFSMIDLALQLNWEGQDDVYKGESKNVALLYEYWLFFELYSIVHSIEGCVELKTNDSPFITDNGGISLSLKEGTESSQAFELVNEGVKLNLYYNRTFTPRDFEKTGYIGSYSREFRPDYTIAVFPNSYVNEKSAVIDGAVSYIHFDAKYRIDKLEDLIGSVKDEKIDTQIADEKQDSIVNTYKRGDLLKMHTYNDAIRRTVGSYVLYPGKSKGKTAFKLYDEPLPGVGAFSFRPSIRDESRSEVRQFIMQIIEVKRQKASRLERMSVYREMVVREPKMQEKTVTFVKNDNLCILGYLRADKPTDYYNFLSANNLLIPGRKFLFYFYAIKEVHVYSHHVDLFSAKHIRFYKNDIHATNTYELEPFICSVESNELVSKEDLVKQLQALGYATTAEQHHADFYYVLSVEVEAQNLAATSLPVAQVNSTNGNDAYSPHSPKVVFFDQ